MLTTGTGSSGAIFANDRSKVMLQVLRFVFQKTSRWFTYVVFSFVDAVILILDDVFIGIITAIGKSK